MSLEISQNLQENICAGILFRCFLVNFAKPVTSPFFAEQHSTTASEYSSINSSEESTVLVNETVNYDTARKAPGLKSLRLNYWEINQATLTCQIDFWKEMSKIEKVNITIKFFVLKLV